MGGYPKELHLNIRCVSYVAIFKKGSHFSEPPHGRGTFGEVFSIMGPSSRVLGIATKACQTLEKIVLVACCNMLGIPNISMDSDVRDVEPLSQDSQN